MMCRIGYLSLNHSEKRLTMAALLLEMLDGLAARGVDVTAEAYPYTAGMTRLDSGVFEPGWEARRVAFSPGVASRGREGVRRVDRVITTAR